MILTEQNLLTADVRLVAEAVGKLCDRELSALISARARIFAAGLKGALSECDFDEVFVAAYPESARDLTRVVQSIAAAMIRAGARIEVEE